MSEHIDYKALYETLKTENDHFVEHYIELIDELNELSEVLMKYQAKHMKMHL